MPYFGEPVGRVKIQATSKNSQRYYTTKRLITDLLSNTPNWYVRANEFHGYLFTIQGMRDRSMWSGTELEWEIQLTDWSMAKDLSNRSSAVQIPCDICTRLKRYLNSAKCSWIIMNVKVIGQCQTLGIGTAHNILHKFAVRGLWAHIKNQFQVLNPFEGIYLYYIRHCSLFRRL